jgi:hypothetical protein
VVQTESTETTWPLTGVVEIAHSRECVARTADHHLNGWHWSRPHDVAAPAGWLRQMNGCCVL